MRPEATVNERVQPFLPLPTNEEFERDEILLFAAGRVIGASAADNQTDEKPIKPIAPIEVPDLYATILDRLGVEFSKELITPIGRPLKVCDGTPVEQLLA